jgi:exodeoxyribonuclease III
MKIMTWNIRQGGGTRRMPGIALALVEHGADVIVMSEVRSTTGGQIAGALADHGWRHQLRTEAVPGRNGMLLASKQPLKAVQSADAPAAAGRWVEVHLPDLGVHIGGVHLPDGSHHRARREYWGALVATARRLRETPAVLIGDFNTGRHLADEEGSTFSCAEMMGRLAALGFVDAWRARHPGEREFTWFSHKGNGFRIDHAFVSPALAGRLRGAAYSHSERENGLSDHSAMVVELD